MIVYTLKTYLGMGLGILSMAGLLVNLIVVVPVFRLAFVQNKSPIYVISFINILIDTINLLVYAFYLSPLIIFQKYPMSELKTDVMQQLMGSMFMFTWYLGSFTQIVMAVNRVVVIYFRRSDIFTKRNILLLFGFLTPFSLFLTYLAQYALPCCLLIFDHDVLSFSYFEIDNTPNYTNLFIDIPLNSSSSLIATMCYITIVWTVRQSTKGIEDSTNNTQPTRRSVRNKELTYAMQFCFISMFYTFGWITFRVLPYLIGDGGLEWFSCISLAVTIDSSANALVYLVTNQEV